MFLYKFTPLFTDILKTQLILKGVITLEDWSSMKEHIQYDFLQDGHFAELKKAELLENRLSQLSTVETYIGTFYSKEWVQKNVLNMTDAEIEEMKDQISKEAGLDPMDGGVPNDGGDGIQRYPTGPDGMPVDPEMDAADRASLAYGMEPEGEEPPPEEG